MKTKITEKGTKGISYPCLKIDGEYELIVLFIGRNEGVVMYKGKSMWGIGHYSKEWAEDGAFEYFNGKIELSNN